MSAISALKGYRTQFIYSLYFILSNQDKNYKFRLEGQEDLDILDESNSLVEIIQVKNLVGSLTQSDLITKDGTSFFKRVIELQSKSPSIKPTLVSFGSIGTELKSWKSTTGNLSSKEKKDIQKFSIKENDWKTLKQTVQFIEVNEDEICQKIISLLKEKYALIDPVTTAENILYWLSVVAEKQIIISQKELFTKVEAIGTYISERVAVTQSYNLVLKPLHQLDGTTSDVSKLKTEFYYGSSARYEHILNNIDVIRPALLNNLQELFRQSNVVVIQGASGQGKSTLAYRYAHDNSPSSLVYELSLQNDPLLSLQSIQAIVSITKGLSAPVLFLINVLPNSTEWLKIVREFADNAFVRFLVTIRHEDWYAAAINGIDFLHKDLELQLDRSEAERIYNSLNEKNEVLGYADFDEAWITFGEQGPLLEFVYSITQGESLKNKLVQQIGQIKKEAIDTNNFGQIELLRIISFADIYGARIDVAKLKGNSKDQFAVERFEKEYLVRQVNEKKHIVGLHPIRSNVIVDILFDEFITSKKDYVLRCILLMDDNDIYHFILKCFYHGNIQPGEFLPSLQTIHSLSWTAYYSLLRSLLWVGIRDYIIENKEPIDACYEKSGDSWYILTDIYHGNTVRPQQFYDLISEDYKTLSLDTNAKLSPKQNVYKYVTYLFNNVTLPNTDPSTNDCWGSLGGVMFWQKNILNNAKQIDCISEEDFELPFKTLDLERLSKLMLGMYYYNDFTNSIRLKHGHHFISRLKNFYKIPDLAISAQEIHINYIIDVLEKTEDVSVHDRVIEIIDLVRNAYPEKEKYNTQGHGHRLNLLASPVDDTRKSISADSLMLDEWVNLNSITIKQYEYTKRPKDWIEFMEHLSKWENSCIQIITDLNSALSSFFESNGEYKYIIPLVDNSQYSTKFSLKEPQSISDPLGLYVKKSVKNKRSLSFNDPNDKKKQHKLTSRHEAFFKSYREYRSAMENFITQSGLAVYHYLKNKQNKAHQIDENNERLTHVNLYSTIEELPTYLSQKKEKFQKYEATGNKTITKDLLYTTAVSWKQFLNRTGSWQKKVSAQKIKQLQLDFEAGILKKLKAIPKSVDYTVKYLCGTSTDDKAVFVINAENYAMFLIGIKDIYAILKDVIGSPDYTSLKQLMLQTNFSEFFFIPIANGRTINNHWYRFPLYVFRDKDFDQLAVHHWVLKPIDDRIISDLKLKTWESVIPKMIELKKLPEEFGRVRVLVEHLKDLAHFSSINLDEIGANIIQSHHVHVGGEIQKSMQSILDLLSALLDQFPFDEIKYSSDEFEKEYWGAIFNIKDHIFPTAKGDDEQYELLMNSEIVSAWAKRLETCSNSVGILNFLLQDKYIKAHIESLSA